VSAILRNPRLFAVWLLLVGATSLSYAVWIGTRWFGERAGGSAVIVIALAKAWLIGMRYMELDEAALPLRLAYGGWVLLVGAMLLAMFRLA
jgi:hypothetical protein